jgi:hypothetical protein
VALNKGAEDLVFPWQILTVDGYTDIDTDADPKNLLGISICCRGEEADGAD